MATDEALPILPSTNPDILLAQLHRDARLLVSTDAPDEVDQPWRYKTYLKRLVGDAWHSVRTGDGQAPARWLSGLSELARLVRSDLPVPEIPAQELARDVYALMEHLETAVDALSEEDVVEDFLSRPPSSLEIAILRELAKNERKFLRRSQVADKLPQSVRPSTSRVGQLLARLHEQGLLSRVERSSRGSSHTAHYALNELGRVAIQQLAKVAIASEPQSTAARKEVNLGNQVENDPDDEVSRRRRSRICLVATNPDENEESLSSAIDYLKQGNLETAEIGNRRTLMGSTP